MDEVLHWDKEWIRRTTPEGTLFNIEKVEILCNRLWSRPNYSGLVKLEVGCGTAYHAASMAAIYPQWKNTYFGIDLSPIAIEKARSHGLKCTTGDIFELTRDDLRDVQVFLFLDVLEHIRDHDRLALKVKELAAKEFIIFGNVPLYLTKSEYERPIDVTDISRFVCNCGIKTFSNEVYGINGYPYMVFEAANAENIGFIAPPG